MTLLLKLGIVIALCGTIYMREILNFFRGLARLKPGANAAQPFVSVLVPARNEEASIAECIGSLLAQDYPAEKLEIIVIDDQSTDRTSEIVRGLSAAHPCIRLLRVTDRPAGVSPKINALQTAIDESRGEIIFTTDADCFVQPGWISACMREFENNVGVVTGTTVFENRGQASRALFGIQFLDFLSHTACAAGAIGNGSVNNCNGSNMAYRRSAYEQAGGYASLSLMNTGDDSLLAQRIASQTPYRVAFALDVRAQVTTFPVTSWKDFLLQRMRWAAQTSDYGSETLGFLIATFLYYVLLLGTGVASLFDAGFLVLFAAGYAPKLIVDYMILRRFTGLTHTRPLLNYYIPAAILHIPVIFIAVAGGYFAKFEWKGRVVERAKK